MDGAADKWELVHQWTEPGKEFRLLTKMGTDDGQPRRVFALERKAEDKLGGAAWYTTQFEWEQRQDYLASLYYASGARL